MERKYTTVKESAAYTDFFIKREGKIPVLSTSVFWVLSRVMRKINSVTYEVGSAKAEQA